MADSGRIGGGSNRPINHPSLDSSESQEPETADAWADKLIDQYRTMHPDKVDMKTVEVTTKPSIEPKELGRAHTWVRRGVLLTAATVALAALANFGVGLGIDRLPVSEPNPNMATVQLVEGHLIGLQENIQDGPRELQAILQGVGSVRIRANLEQGGAIVGSPNAGLALSPDTQVSLSLNRRSFTVQSQPGLHAQIPYFPDVDVTEIRFNFDTGTFEARAEGMGPDEWYTDRVERLANRLLLPQIPEAMRQPGYDPVEDPNIVQNLAMLVGNFSPNSEAPPPLNADAEQVAPSSAPSDVSSPAADPSVTDVTIGASVTLSESVQVVLPERCITIPEGTRFNFSVATDGPVDDPRLNGFTLTFSQPLDLGQMQLRGLHLRPGGEITADYDLEIEQTITGLRALVMMTAVLAEPRLAGQVGSFESTELTGVRRKIQNHIDDNAEPHFEALIRGLDEQVPGFDLTQFFGFANAVDGTPRN